MDDPVEPGSGRSPFSRSDIALIAVAVLALGGGAAWWFLRRPQSPPPAPAPAVEPAPTAAAPSGPVVTAAPPLPAAELKAALDAVTRDATLRGLLAGDDLADRGAVLIAHLASGTSPRKLLAPLAPSKPFAASTSGGRSVIDPASYHRFDASVGALLSIDTHAAAAAWTLLHPALEVAWRALGEPEPSLDRAMARALGRIEAAPVVEGEVAVVASSDAKGSLWLLADPKLEALPAVEKHLLRMGPRHTRALKLKATELRNALGLPPAPPGKR